jgi:hypothetical protein
LDLSANMAPGNVLELEQACTYRIVVPALPGGISLFFVGLPLGLGAAANEATPGGSVTVTPPGGGPTVIPIGGAETAVPVPPAGGTITVQVVSTGTRALGGNGYQGMFVQWRFPDVGCSTNYQCQSTDPLHPFCGGGACHDGGADEPCDDSASCDYDGQLTICDEVSGTCQPEGEVLNEP